MSPTASLSFARRAIAYATLVVFAFPPAAFAQTPGTTFPPQSNTAAPPSGTSQPAATQPSSSEKTFSKEELEQLAAPIALYPDSLLAQVMMASTYPLEVVSADRWVKANPKLKDKALEDALQKQTWDPAVKSLCVLPQVLAMMSEKLDWTQKLGDAFLAQQPELLSAVQTLRNKAVEQGSLKDSKEQKVVTEKVESTTVIKIEPTNPEVVYVPTYNPTVVYGGWPYPAYPPYYYYPPGYVAGGALLGFTAGVIVGGALWGNCNWGRGDVNVNVNRYNNFNRTNISNSNWNHNVNHRGAVPYKDKGVANQYRGGGQGGAGAQARDSYRGRTDSAGGRAGATSAGARDVSSRGGATGASAGGRDFGGGSADRAGASSSFNRDFSGTKGSSAFDAGSRAQTQSSSSRGSSSMSSARSSGGGGARAGGGGGGGARGGGGGGRGGGGRR